MIEILLMPLSSILQSDFDDDLDKESDEIDRVFNSNELEYKDENEFDSTGYDFNEEEV